jgi:hypothetical protein
VATKKDLDAFRGQMGQDIVAYELMKRGWNVLVNTGTQGFDLLVVSADNRVQRRVEVKTTDPSLKTGRWQRQLTVVLTEPESKEADFLVFYVHGHDTFFVIPNSAFPPSRSVTVTISKKQGDIGERTRYEPYRNAWDQLG